MNVIKNPSKLLAVYISVWTKAVEWETNISTPTAAGVAKKPKGLLNKVEKHLHVTLAPC